MKLNELVNVMNMAQLDVQSRTIDELARPVALNMFAQDRDGILKTYGDREVEQVTNICKLGVTIWIK